MKFHAGQISMGRDLSFQDRKRPTFHVFTEYSDWPVFADRWNVRDNTVYFWSDLDSAEPVDEVSTTGLMEIRRS